MPPCPGIMEPMHAARYTKPAGNGVQCLLCPHGCRLGEGETGRCRVRTVVGGMLQADGYGRISAAHLDPIEKKPLYHFYPGSMVYSIGGYGCNFHCRFCQNWSVSQQFRSGAADVARVEDIVCQAVGTGAVGVAYTYNEPLVGWEFVHDCALAVHDAGLKNVLVTNGYVNAEPAAALLPLMDAVNLDIKSMDDGFYRELCGGSLAPVLRFAREAVAVGTHLEVTNLLIPGANSADLQIDTLVSWIAESLHERIPLHITAYRPEYAMTYPATVARDLQRAFGRAKRRLTFVYSGNLDMDEGRDTRCRICDALLVHRATGFEARITGLTADGQCRDCGAGSGIRVHGSTSP